MATPTDSELYNILENPYNIAQAEAIIKVVNMGGGNTPTTDLLDPSDEWGANLNAPPALFTSNSYVTGSPVTVPVSAIEGLQFNPDGTWIYYYSASTERDEDPSYQPTDTIVDQGRWYPVGGSSSNYTFSTQLTATNTYSGIGAPATVAQVGPVDYPGGSGVLETPLVLSTYLFINFTESMAGVDFQQSSYSLIVTIKDNRTGGEVTGYQIVTAAAWAQFIPLG